MEGGPGIRDSSGASGEAEEAAATETAIESLFDQDLSTVLYGTSVVFVHLITFSGINHFLKYVLQNFSVCFVKI